MGRPKKYSDNDLLEIAQNYISYGPGGKPTYQKIAQWAAQNGYEIGEQLFRKCAPVRDLIKLEQKKPAILSTTSAVTYVPFDAEAAVRKLSSQRSIQEHLKVLQEREMYYRNMYDLINTLRSHVQKLSSDLKEANRKIESLEDELVSLQNTKKENRNLIAASRTMRAILEQTIYPDVAIHILHESGIVETDSNLSEKSVQPYVCPNPEASHQILAQRSTQFTAPESGASGADILAWTDLLKKQLGGKS